MSISLNQILLDSNLCISTNSRGTDKGNPKLYIKLFYEKEFGRLRKIKNRLIEIGVRSGASLSLWAKYFPDIEIFGFDIEDVGTSAGPLQKYIDCPNIKFYCIDAYQTNIADMLEGKFTILIDDGPHTLKSQCDFLELYLNKLDENGVLIIEDILFGYRDCFQLMTSLPKGNKYKFEIYDFEKIQAGGGFLFVVRHNLSSENLIWIRTKISLFAFYELFLVFLRRVKRGDFSFKNRRKN